MGEWNPLTFKNICRNQRGEGISGGPLRCAFVPEFVGMASALIGTIWAAAAALRGAEGREQRELVRERSWGNALLQEASRDPTPRSARGGAWRGRKAVPSHCLGDGGPQAAQTQPTCGHSIPQSHLGIPALLLPRGHVVAVGALETGGEGGLLEFSTETDSSLFPPLPVPSIWKQDKMSRIS